MADTAMREALEAAFEDDAKKQEEEPVIEAVAPTPEEPASEPSTPEPTEPSKPEERPEPMGAEPAATGDPAPAEPAAEAPGIRPPASWKPAAREKWNNVPGEIKAEVNRREREILRTMEEAANGRKFADAFHKTVAPYQQFMAADGVNPLQATANLMQTAAGLRVGTPMQKAQIVAEIINNFGIDVQALDGLLVGNPEAQPGAASNNDAQIGQMLDQRLAPINNFMNNIGQMQNDYNSQTEQTLNSEIDDFATGHEFFDDVREEMADMMEMAGNRNQTLTMEEAYNRAVQFNPDIAAIMTQRTGAGNAEQTRVQLREKADAASSLVPSRGGSDPTPGEPTTLRAALEKSVAKHGGL